MRRFEEFGGKSRVVVVFWIMSFLYRKKGSILLDGGNGKSSIRYIEGVVLFCRV